MAARILLVEDDATNRTLARRILDARGFHVSEAVDGQDALNALAISIPDILLLDLSLPISIELGRTSMTVQDILRLGRGSVIQLDRLAGEPIDVYVGDRRFAEGEVVLLGETFGVRVTRILPRANAVEEIAA